MSVVTTPRSAHLPRIVPQRAPRCGISVFTKAAVAETKPDTAFPSRKAALLRPRPDRVFVKTQMAQAPDAGPDSGLECGLWGRPALMMLETRRRLHDP
jgi:hypothetical protein